jgi:hypothetical protein
MKVTPVATAVQATTAGASNASQDARARAIAKLTSAPSTPVQSQNNVSPEEMGSIKPGQSSTSEGNAPNAAPENAQEKPPTAAAEESEVSSKFEQLAKREKQLRAQAIKQDQSLKAREAAIAAKEAELAAKAKAYEDGYISKDRLKSDPYGVLAETGVTYDEVTNQFLENSTPVDPRTLSQIEKLEAKIKALEAKTEETEKSQKSAQQTAYDNAVKQLANDTKALVNSDSSFETIKATGSEMDVVKLIERTYHEENVLLTVQEAAQLVEDQLVEAETKRIQKLIKLGKISKQLQPVAPAEGGSEKKTDSTQAQQQPVKTLTNEIASSRQLSAKERAILAFKGELK